MIAQSAPYTHRCCNGLFESICRVCYRTVAAEMIEADLAEDEGLHICNQDYALPGSWSVTRWNSSSKRSDKKPN